MKPIARWTRSPASGRAAPLALKSFTALAAEGVNLSGPPAMDGRSILLLSEDAQWAARVAAGDWGTTFHVLRTSSVSEAVERMRMARPCAAALDLDLPSDAGWQAAEWLLHEAAAVPIILLTLHADHYELEAGIRFGTVVSKSAGPSRFIRTLNWLLAQSEAERLTRAASQQAWLRRARPYRWTERPAQPYRQWGINE